MIYFVIFYILPAIVVWYAMRVATIKKIKSFNVENTGDALMGMFYMLCPIVNIVMMIIGSARAEIIPKDWPRYFMLLKDEEEETDNI